MRKWFILMSCLLIIGCANNGKVRNTKVKIVGHRGASQIAPENTVASTKLAYKQDADISEIDIYLSKDHKIMVIHDTTTKRTGGINYMVTSTDSKDLRELEVGSWKNPYYYGEKIPFLEEILDVVPEGKKLFIEVKYSVGIAPYIKEAIDKSGKKDQMVIISSSLDLINQCKKEMPDIPTYWVKASEKNKETGEFLPYDDSVIQVALDNKLTGLDLLFRGLNKEFVDKAHKAGLEVYVWTVDDINIAKQMVEIGVDGITTNVPGVMKAEL